ncbi:MAG: aldehyde dehydrogenase family protein [Candidatus Limiplasma sp.]|nr:aldehyde dehydrogenase family protein [Candidatus Limiplasma sp.]
MDAIGIQGDPKCRLVICEVAANHPLVTVEQMMPVLPIVRCTSFEEAVQSAVAAEHGNRHTASIFSQNVTHMTVFGRAIETTIFVKNSATKAGVGIGGEGHCTMTIAGPTGEGITCAKSFCRRRRCVLAEGGLRVV